MSLLAEKIPRDEIVFISPELQTLRLRLRRLEKWKFHPGETSPFSF
jgi:hypothetical protein